MAEDAEGPDVAEFTVCGRAVDSPVAGSALPGGHRPRVAFFRPVQLAESEVGGAVPLDCTEDAEMVEVDEMVELVEAREDEEFCRCAVLRGAGANILLTSFGLVSPKPLELVGHPIRLLDWKDRGAATAVI
jgi:hypothetical protein